MTLCSIVLGLLTICLAAPLPAEVKLPAAPLNEPIAFGAPSAAQWREGEQEVWLLAGRCYLNQGVSHVSGDRAVLWVERGRYGERTGKVTAYLEGAVEVKFSRAGNPAPEQAADAKSSSWLGTFESSAPLEIRVPQVGPEPKVKPAVYQTALMRRDPSRNQGIRRTQFTEAAPAPAGGSVPPAGTRRLQVFPRSSAPPTIDYFPNNQQNEWIALITGGVNLVVDGLENYGSIDVSSDRIVVWTGGLQEPSFGPSTQTLQRDDTPLEIYMEGNIVFRQGERIIEAQRMYYDVRGRVGIVLEADVLTPVPQYQGLVRLRASVVRQLGQDRFLAEDAFLTTSRLGRPGYRLQSGEIFFEDQQRPVFDAFTGAPAIDPKTGEQQVGHSRLATSRSNFLYLDELPVFYWPFLATDLDSPEFYIKRITVGADSVFGTQVKADLDLYQILGIDNPLAGTSWEASLDYLSDRGLGVGTNFNYQRPSVLGFDGPASGILDAWAIYEQGIDNLGSDRRDVPPEEDFRYRILGGHRQNLANGYQFTAELGLISDRNFLEQYYEAEYEQGKDQITGFELKRILDNMSYGISVDARLNDFFAQTEWLPRLDHFWLGQPLLGDRLTWFEHSSAGYARLRAADPPTNPVDAAKFGLMPWEANVEGERFVTRQEIDYPIALGALKVVPYALGELAHYGEDLTGDDLQRAYGQVGLRASVPFWSVSPQVENWLLNIHGIAHKVVFDADLSFADANRDLTELPLYEQLDDDNLEQFRRRLGFNTFGVPPAAIPLRFDERFYALRSGLGGVVTSPSTEIADDLAALRMGVRQRWQTKRGPENNRRILDFIVLDTEAVFFPNEDRDNFGESLGLINYDFRWHVGDRTTIVSDGVFDLFDQGQELVSLGAFLNRPGRGSLYLGYHSLQGPIDAQVLTASYNYRMSPKWISAVGTSVDIGGGGNIGQAISLTRIGESFLTSFGFNVDASKGNVGFIFSVEPRFLPRSRLGSVGGVAIPPAGLSGLE